MTKIAFIGGGSVQWTTGLLNDMILTPELRGADLVLYDIDAQALELMTPICKRIVKQLDGEIAVICVTRHRPDFGSGGKVVLTQSTRTRVAGSAITPNDEAR